jgi:hypothetical protein
MRRWRRSSKVLEQFSDFGGALGQRGGKAAKVVQKVVDAGAEAEARIDVGMAQALLEGAEEALSPGQAKYHGAQFSQDSIPSLTQHSRPSPWQRC